MGELHLTAFAFIYFFFIYVSGKSMCYLIPILQDITEDRNSRALFLFPTKALAQVFIIFYLQT
jgi:hypothetical protein